MVGTINCYSNKELIARYVIEAETIEDAEKRFLESDSFFNIKNRLQFIEIEMAMRKIRFIQ